MIWVDSVQRCGEGCVASVTPLTRQNEQGDARRDQRQPSVNIGNDYPGKDCAECRSQSPRCWRVKDEPGFAIGEVRQRRPARINNTLFPFRENFQPTVEMELHIVAGRGSEKEEWK